MKKTRKMRRLPGRMAGSELMERGKVCKMAGRAHYNHQAWRSGRNVVRYVPAERVASLREAIAGYKLFRKLAEEYANEVVRRTRAQNAPPGKRRPTQKLPTAPKRC